MMIKIICTPMDWTPRLHYTLWPKRYVACARHALILPLCQRKYYGARCRHFLHLNCAYLLQCSIATVDGMRQLSTCNVHPITCIANRDLQREPGIPGAAERTDVNGTYTNYSIKGNQTISRSAH